MEGFSPPKYSLNQTTIPWQVHELANPKHEQKRVTSSMDIYTTSNLKSLIIMHHAYKKETKLQYAYLYLPLFHVYHTHAPHLHVQVGEPQHVNFLTTAMAWGGGEDNLIFDIMREWDPLKIILSL